MNLYELGCALECNYHYHKVQYFLLFVYLMGSPVKHFAEYVKNQQSMDAARKRTIKRDVVSRYDFLYIGDQQARKRNSFFTFFQGPMTLTRLAMYAISIFTFTTGAYAAVAPQSFARISASVQTGISSAIDSSLVAVGLKTTQQVATDTEINQENDDGTREKGTITQSDNDTEGTVFVEGKSSNKARIQIDGDVEVQILGHDKKSVDDAVIGNLKVNTVGEAKLIGNTGAAGSHSAQLNNEVLIDSALENIQVEEHSIDASLGADMSVKSISTVGSADENKQEIKSDNTLEGALGIGL